MHSMGPEQATAGGPGDTQPRKPAVRPAQSLATRFRDPTLTTLNTTDHAPPPSLNVPAPAGMAPEAASTDTRATAGASAGAGQVVPKKPSSPRKGSTPRKNQLPRYKPITAKELLGHVRSLVAVPPAQLPETWGPLHVCDLLQADRWQQRVFSWGNSPLAPVTAQGQAASSPTSTAAAHGLAQQLGHTGPVQVHDVTPVDTGSVEELRDQLPQRYTSSQPLSLVEGVEFTCISAGKAHGAAASTHPDGHVYVWGSNQWSQLGLPTSDALTPASDDAGGGPAQPLTSHLLTETTDVRAAPTLQELVPGLPVSLLGGMAASEAKDAHTAWRQQDDHRMDDLDRQLNPGASGARKGAAPTKAAAAQAAEDAPASGKQVESLAVLHVYRLRLGRQVTHMACGAAHTLACGAGGGVWGWGSNTNGQVGVPNTTPVVATPTVVPELARVVVRQLGAGGAHSAAVTQYGDVWTWGDCSWGQCGVGRTSFSEPPARVTTLNGKKVVQVACGTAHCLALTSEGEVYSWGGNWANQLGVQDTKDRVYPVKLTHLPRCTALAAASISLAISTAGRLYVWGWDQRLNPRPEWPALGLGGRNGLGVICEEAAMTPEASAALPPALPGNANPLQTLIAECSARGLIGAEASVGSQVAAAGADTDRSHDRDAELAVAGFQHGSEPVPPDPAGSTQGTADEAGPIDAHLLPAEGACDGSDAHSTLDPTGTDAQQPDADTQPPEPAAAGSQAAQGGQQDFESAGQPPPVSDKESWAAAPRALPSNLQRRKARVSGQPAPPVPPPPPPPPPMPPPGIPHFVLLPPGGLLGIAGSEVPAPPSVPLPPDSAPPAYAQPYNSNSSSAASVAGSVQGVQGVQGSPVRLPDIPVIREVTWLQPQAVRAVACSTTHVVVVTKEGVMYMWGDEKILSHHTKSHLAHRLQAPQPPHDRLTPGALQQLSQQGPGHVLSHHGHTSPHSVTNPGCSKAGSHKSDPVSDVLSEAAFSAESAPPLAAEQPAVAMSPFAPASKAAAGEEQLPVAVGGACLTALCAPDRGTAVWALFADAAVLQARGLTAPAPQAASPDQPMQVRLRINVFNGELTVALDLVPVSETAPKAGLASLGNKQHQRASSRQPQASTAGTLTARQSSPNKALSIRARGSQSGRAKKGSKGSGAVDEAAEAAIAQHLLQSVESDFPELMRVTSVPEAMADLHQVEVEVAGGLYGVRHRAWLNPARETVYALAAGELHTLCLCGTTRYAPVQDELHQCALHLLHSFTSHWRQSVRRPTSPLPDDTQQIRDSGQRELANPRAVLEQSLRPPPWNEDVQATPCINLQLATSVCKMVGLLDNVSEFQEVAMCFSCVLQQRAKTQAAGLRLKPGPLSKQGQQTSGSNTLSSAHNRDEAWRVLQADIARDLAALRDAQDMARGLALAHRDRTPSPQRDKRAGSPSIAAGSAHASLDMLLKGRGALTVTEFVDMLLMLMAERLPTYAPWPALLMRMLCKRHLCRLPSVVKNPLVWLNARASDPELLLQVDSGEASEALHQCYIFMTYGTGSGSQAAPTRAAEPNKAGVVSDLLLPLHDAKRGLRQPGCRSHVPLSRVAAFLRQAGLLPKILSKLLTELMMEVEEAYRQVPLAEQAPWWWPRARTPPSIPGGYGDFRKMPTNLEPISRQVLMAALNDFDILDMPIPRSRKAFAAAMNSELYLQLEARKRERLLAYVLVAIMGRAFSSLNHPSQLEPSRLLQLPISYPQFIEAICVCLVLRCATQDGRRIAREARTSWPSDDMTAAIRDMQEGIRVWRDKLLNPWRYKRVLYSDAELERMVDKAFSLYCTIDPLAERVGVAAPALLKIVDDSHLLDEYISVERLNRIFMASEAIADEDAANFGSSDMSTQKAHALAVLPSAAAAAATWSGLTATQLARIKQSPIALAVAQESLHDQLADARDRGQSNLLLGRPQSRHTPEPARSESRQGKALRQPSPESAQQRRFRLWDAHTAALDAAPRAGDDLWTEEDGRQLPSPRRRSRARIKQTQSISGVSDHDQLKQLAGRLSLAPPSPVPDTANPGGRTSPAPDNGPSVPTGNASYTAGASQALLGVLAGEGVPQGLRAADKKTSRVAERVASPTRSHLSKVRAERDGSGAMDVAELLERHLEAVNQHFSGDSTGGGAARCEDSDDELSTCASPTYLLRKLQSEVLGAEVEQGMLGGALQRWNSFSTVDFGRTPGCMSSANHTPASGSPPLTPSHSTPRHSSPTRFLDPNQPLSPSTAGAQGKGASSRGSLSPSVSRGGRSRGGAVSQHAAPGVCGPEDSQAARDAAEAVRAARAASGQDTQGGGLTTATSSGPAQTVPLGFAGSQWPPVLGSVPEHQVAVQNPSEDVLVEAPGWLANSRSVWSAPDSAPSGDQAMGSQGRPAARLGSEEPFADLPAMLSVGPGSVHATEVPSDSEEGSPRTTTAGAPSHQKRPSTSVSLSPRSPRSPSRRTKKTKTSDAVNRLTTTRAALGAQADEDSCAQGPTPSAAQLERLVLSRAQFGEALRRIAVAKYAKISSPTAAWRILVERHILPLAETSATKYDKFLQLLMAPSVIATILAWEPQLKQVFHVYAEDSEALAANAAAKQEALAAAKGDQEEQPAEELPGLREDSESAQTPSAPRSTVPGLNACTRDLAMTFLQFLQLCQDQGLVGPQGLAPMDLEQVFRRVHFLDGDFSSTAVGMAYTQFVDAASMTGMMLLTDEAICQKLLPQLSKLPASATPEVRLSAFFTHLCGLKRPPPAVIQAMQAAGATRQQLSWAQPGVTTTQQDLYSDPYQEWWALAGKGFGAEEDNKPHSYLSSVHYKPVLLQELVVPPPPCPAAVVPLLDKATALHNAGDYQEALTVYAEARAAWRGAAIDPNLGHRAQLSTHQKLYFALATAAVHVSAGRAPLALTVYESLSSDLAKLPDDHPNRATVASAYAYALFAAGNLEQAYEQFVQAKVLRDQASTMGPSHVDSALAAHNLGCCLDALGQGHKALQLVQAAEQIFRRVLGPSHPRTEVAARNLAHLQHRAIDKVEMRYCIPVPPKPKVKKTEIPFSKTRKVGLPAPPAQRQAPAAAPPIAAGTAADTTRQPPAMLTPAQRLAAFQLRTPSMAPGQQLAPSRARSSPGSPQRPVHVKRYKKPTDLDYIGGGMFAATPDMVALWDQMKPLVEAHAAGKGDAKVTTDPTADVVLSEPSPTRTADANELSDPLLTATATVGQSRAQQNQPTATAGLPKVVTRGPVTDPSIAPRKLAPKVAMQMYAAAMKAGLQLPGIAGPAGSTSGVAAAGARASALSSLSAALGLDIGASGKVTNARKNIQTAPVIRDRLGELLGPAPVDTGKGRRDGRQRAALTRAPVGARARSPALIRRGGGSSDGEEDADDGSDDEDDAEADD